MNDLAMTSHINRRAVTVLFLLLLTSATITLTQNAMASTQSSQALLEKMVAPDTVRAGSPFSFAVPEVVQGEIVVQTAKGAVLKRISTDRYGRVFLADGLPAGSYRIVVGSGRHPQPFGQIQIQQPAGLSVNTSEPMQISNAPHAVKLADPLALSGHGFNPNSSQMQVSFGASEVLVMAATEDQLKLAPPKQVPTGQAGLKLTNRANGKSTEPVPVLVYDMQGHLDQHALASGGSQTELVVNIKPDNIPLTVHAKVVSGPVNFGAGKKEADSLTSQGMAVFPVRSEAGSGPFQLDWTIVVPSSFGALGFSDEGKPLVVPRPPMPGRPTPSEPIQVHAALGISSETGQGNSQVPSPAATPIPTPTPKPFPTLSKSFSPASVSVGASSTLTLTITNAAGNPSQMGIAFVDMLPPGLMFAGTPMVNCPGPALSTMTATVSGNSLAGHGAMLPGVHTCTIIILVTANACGALTNGPPNIQQTANIDPSGASATLQVTGTNCNPDKPSLTINKVFTGVPPGFTGTFVFNVVCATPNGPVQQQVSLVWPGTSVTVPGVLAGSSCSVQEGPPPVLPSGYDWNGLPQYSVPNGVIHVGAGANVVTVTNSARPCNGDGQITITKKMEGVPQGFTGTFKFNIACTSGAGLVTQQAQITLPGTGTVTVTGLPAGAVCTVSETSLAVLPAPYQWSSPTYIPASGVVTLVGTCCGTIEVDNTAKYCCTSTTPPGPTGNNNTGLPNTKRPAPVKKKP